MAKPLSVTAQPFSGNQAGILKQLLSAGVLLITGFAFSAQAHMGDRIYPLFELTDGDLEKIDLTDGSVEEWREIVGEPTLIFDDFVVDLDPEAGGHAEYDPSSLDYRIWLGWHDASNHIYVAAQFVDNVYVNEYDPSEGMMQRNDSISFLVDGDHGGDAWFTRGGGEDISWKQNRWAQRYDALAVTPDEHHVGMWTPWTNWMTYPPYADGGGSAMGEQPVISVLEFYVTPFDDMIWDKPEDSQITDLFPGKAIGFAVLIWDVDTEPGNPDSFHILPGVSHEEIINSGGAVFADGVLVGPSGTPPEVTIVENDTWGRIKASFRE